MQVIAAPRRVLSTIARAAILASRPIRRASRPVLAPTFAAVLRTAAGHRLLNAIDGVLPFEGRKMLLYMLGLATERLHRPARPFWLARLGTRPLSMPTTTLDELRQALLVVGHDVEVKRLYHRLLRSATPPNLFLDIGANVGLDTVIFLNHKVETISFEPSNVCIPQIEALCAKLGLTPLVVPVALGAASAQAELVAPIRDNTIGTIDQRSSAAILNGRDRVRRQTVDVLPLDYFHERAAGKRVLIKIDTEGHELQVLLGAARFLQDRSTIVVFESLQGDPTRERLYSLLSQFGMTVSTGRRPNRTLSRDEFVSSWGRNFVARHPAVP